MMTSTDPTAIQGEPRRGEVWLASLGNARHGEPGKNRPVVIVADDALGPYLPTALVPVVPISSSRAHGPDRPILHRGNGLESDSVAVARAIRGVARNRLLHRLGAVSPNELAELDFALTMILGLAR